ncbi:MAG: class I SAM-dependent methyltransferase [Pyrinomonadaceae bacterium]
MALEATLFRRTRLGTHRHCLELVEAYAAFATLWERFCLAAYVGIGPGVARCFGADTSAMWKRADAIIADVMASSGLSPREIAGMLRRYVKLRLEEEDHLPFDEARARIYDQPFYPVVTHFTFALQPSAVARLKFVGEVVNHMTAARATVADLGCGSGMMLCEVLKMKPSWTGYGLDVSRAAVDYARRLAAHKGVAARAGFQAGDITNLPYRSESLDLVIASEVIEHTPEPARVVEEIASALRPGGQVVLTMPMESHTPCHLNALNRADDLRSLCERARLSVRRIEPRWHFGFGDDRKHIFVLAEKVASQSQRIAAARSGMVSS